MQLNYITQATRNRCRCVIYDRMPQLTLKKYSGPSKPEPKSWVVRESQWVPPHQREHTRQFWKVKEVPCVPGICANAWLLPRRSSRTVCWFPSQRTLRHSITRPGSTASGHDSPISYSQLATTIFLLDYGVSLTQFDPAANSELPAKVQRIYYTAAAQPRLHLLSSISVHPFICRNRQDVMHRRRWTEASNDEAVSLRGFLESFVAIQVGLAPSQMNWCL